MTSNNADGDLQMLENITGRRAAPFPHLTCPQQILPADPRRPRRQERRDDRNVGTGQIFGEIQLYSTLLFSVVYCGSSLCAFLVSKPMGRGLTTAFPDSSMASLFSGLPPAVVRRPKSFSPCSAAGPLSAVFRSWTMG